VGLRTTLSRHSLTVIAVLLLLVAAAVAFAMRDRLAGAVPGQALVEQRFYTTDDGATWFKDTATRIPPFMYNGKEAVEAKVYRVGETGPEFVAYMTRYTPEAALLLEREAKSPNSVDVMEREAARIGGIEVKRPGTSVWVRSTKDNAAEFDAATAVVAPAGAKGVLWPVTP